MKEEKFEKVVKYYVSQDEKNIMYSCGVTYYFSELFAMLTVWIFFPLFFIFKKDCMMKGKRKVFWRKIK